MKTKSYHITLFGKFAPAIGTNTGYVIYHDSPRYSKASTEQLNEWAKSRIETVRNAALTERAERRVREWNNRNTMLYTTYKNKDSIS
jgi:hypothetical protein